MGREGAELPATSENEEPLLRQSTRRFVLFPIQYPAIWSLYKDAMASFWTVEELDPYDDIRDWNLRLQPHEQHFISLTISSLALSQSSTTALVERFCDDVQVAEARCFYGFQIMMQNIHSETYSLLLATYQVRESACTAEEMPYYKRKEEWIRRRLLAHHLGFAERLVGFIAMEGIFSSASYASISALAKRGLMSTLCLSNTLISRDKALYTRFSSLLFSYLRRRPSIDVTRAIFREAVEIAQAFVTDELPVSLIGLNPTLMCRYIEYVADRLLESIGYPKIYNSWNPFDFIPADTLPKQSLDNALSMFSLGPKVFTLDEEF